MLNVRWAFESPRMASIWSHRLVLHRRSFLSVWSFRWLHFLLSFLFIRNSTDSITIRFWWKKYFCYRIYSKNFISSGTQQRGKQRQRRERSSWKTKKNQRERAGENGRGEAKRKPNTSMMAKTWQNIHNICFSSELTFHKIDLNNFFQYSRFIIFHSIFCFVVIRWLDSHHCQRASESKLEMHTIRISV